MTYEISIVLGLNAVTFLFFYLSSKLRESHVALQFLLVITGMINIVASGSILISIAENHVATLGSGIASVLTTIYTMYIIITIFIVAYFIVMFIVAMLKKLSESAGQKDVDVNDLEVY